MYAHIYTPTDAERCCIAAQDRWMAVTQDSVLKINNGWLTWLLMQHLCGHAATRGVQDACQIILLLISLATTLKFPELFESNRMGSLIFNLFSECLLFFNKDGYSSWFIKVMGKWKTGIELGIWTTIKNNVVIVWSLATLKESNEKDD